MSIKDKLIAARALIAEPGQHAQESYATDANGRDVSTISCVAVCRCQEGAVLAAYDFPAIGTAGVYSKGHAVDAVLDLLRSEADALVRELKIDVPAEHVEFFRNVLLNDGIIRIPHLTPHQAVLLVMDRAIARAAS